MRFDIRILSWAQNWTLKILLPCCKQVCFKTICKRTNVCEVLPKFLLFPCRMPWFVHLALFPIRKSKPINQQKGQNYDVFRCKMSHRVKRRMSAIDATTSMHGYKKRCDLFDVITSIFVIAYVFTSKLPWLFTIDLTDIFLLSVKR